MNSQTTFFLTYYRKDVNQTTLNHTILQHFMNINGICSNFVKYESFFESNSGLSKSCSSGLFLSSEASICSKMAFPLLGNSDQVVLSVSINVLSSTNLDAPFQCMHSLRDVPWGISLNLVLLLLEVNFLSGFRLELMYIFLIKNISPSLCHLYRFKLILLIL